MNWFKKKIDKPQFEFNDCGKLKLHKGRNGCSWFGRVNLSISHSLIELTIEVVNENEPSGEQIQLIKEFENNWETLSDKLFEYMTESFRDSKWEKDKDDLKKMYYLSAIDLKKDTSEWWIVMEPDFNVVTIFNFLPRFTVRNSKIIWSNFK